MHQRTPNKISVRAPRLLITLLSCYTRAILKASQPVNSAKPLRARTKTYT